MKEMNEKPRFVKKRNYQKSYGWKLWKRWRRSKPEREARAYAYMKEHGIPCPDHVEYHDVRNALGLLMTSELSMDQLEGTKDLRYICLLDEFKAIREEKQFRRSVILKLAAGVRKMHDCGFFHLNLNFRNVVARIDQGSDPDIYFIDVTSARIQPPAYRRPYMQRKELAFLYKDARSWCSLREMILFYKTYRRISKLTQEDRDYMKTLVAYAESKWGNRSSGLND